ncbi:histidine--tRNA ligase [Spirochaetia bacterium 38H-sp]|uniref:Histidine--tRNA ligase n=1 Tax=Rarispira pelagica TaxID=3141764 RepID=A0ABU9UC34_9SPIR
MIEPRILKGFRDFLPEQQSIRKNIIRRLEETFVSCGYMPIDTPVLEYADVLLGKSGGDTEKQVYRFSDHGGRDVAMRFDLTVPFARFMAQHSNELYLPFRRYHIDKVFRGENTQKGRYREFVQCDFDIVGTDSVSSDVEILLLMYRSFKAIGVEDITINIAHRGVTSSVLSALGLDDPMPVLRAIDKLFKIGREGVIKELEGIADKSICEKILDTLTMEDSPEKTLARLSDVCGKDNPHIMRLLRIWNILSELGLSHVYTINPSITRGLDYYTGVVFETFLNKLPGIGSVCSGGRYDNLVGLYSKENITGIGASIGLDRLIAGLTELGITEDMQGDNPDVLILCMSEELLPLYHRLAETLRDNKIKAEVYPDNKRFKQQFSYAEKKNIPFAIIIGEDEQKSGKIELKDLTTREQYSLSSEEELISLVIRNKNKK